MFRKIGGVTIDQNHLPSNVGVYTLKKYNIHSESMDMTISMCEVGESLIQGC